MCRLSIVFPPSRLRAESDDEHGVQQQSTVSAFLFYGLASEMPTCLEGGLNSISSLGSLPSLRNHNRPIVTYIQMWVSFPPHFSLFAFFRRMFRLAALRVACVNLLCTSSQSGTTTGQPLHTLVPFSPRCSALLRRVSPVLSSLLIKCTSSQSRLGAERQDSGNVHEPAWCGRGRH